ncbi:hypothetical protein FJZ33_13275 [Candidatus Poribacteria bacterium]|nr:hypothetical protein [Candidatus Poribacteria bacterium]
MKQILADDEIEKIRAEFKMISDKIKVSYEFADVYSESRDQAEGIFFDTESLEGFAFSYIKALDIIKFIATKNRTVEFIQILELLRPLRSVNRLIDEYVRKDKKFRVFMNEELRDAIEPYESFMLDVINWVAHSIYSESNTPSEEDEEDDFADSDDEDV